MKRAIFYPFFLCIALLFATTTAVKAEEAPDAMLKRITQEMISSLRQSDQKLNDDPRLIFRIVDKIIVPYIDWEVMSHWVVGRNAWAKATPNERQRFVAAFRNLLIRSYANTLKAYNNQTIDYLPVRGGTEGKGRIQINSVIRSPGQEAIRVSYRLAKKDSGWKVYDISIEGVSLLKGFQSQFAAELQQQGLDKLIQRIQKHNEKPLPGK